MRVLDLKFKVFSAMRRPSIAILSLLNRPRRESVILTQREEGIFLHIFPAVSIALIGCSPSEKLVEHMQRPLLVAKASDAELVESGHEDVCRVNTALIGELQLEESAMARGAGRRGGLGVPEGVKQVVAGADVIGEVYLMLSVYAQPEMLA
jgi:hypothetical protein